jgi:ATP-dependent DNA helicase RecQ
MKLPKQNTNVTKQATALLSQLLALETGRKSHQLILAASEMSEGKLAPGQWLNILDALVHKGFLSVDLAKAELIITERGRHFIDTDDEFQVDIDQPAPILPPEVQPKFDETLYNKLRWKRRVLAEEEGIPVYRIFSNRTLAEMATYRPESLEDLKSLHGVGDQLSTKYGQTFLNAIQYFLKSVA